MRNLKKFLALVLVLVMTMSVMSFAGAAYADADDINYKEAVDVMSYAGIFNGIDGEFQPDGKLTREQAMKIVAYLLLGQRKADSLPKDVQSFTDVEAGRWSAGAIAYCASKGIVSGDGTGYFYPTLEVNGYAFGKMVMGAAGIKGEFTGNGWEFNVAVALDEKGLLYGLEDVVLSESLTREQACQMAFNAAQYSTNGKYTGRYKIVAVSEKAAIMDGEMFDSRTDAIVTMTAMKFELNTDYTLAAEIDKSNSLLYKVHKVYDGTFTDDFKFQTYAWYAFDSEGEMVVINAAPYGHYDHYENGAVTGGNLFASLGLTKYDDSVWANVYTDGNWSEVEVKFNDKTPVVGGNGVATTIFWNPYTESLKVIEVTTYIGVVSNVRAAKAETATKLPVPAMADITVGEDTYANIKTDAYKDGDVVLVTIAGDKIQSHELAETVVGTVDKYVAGKTVTVNGTTLKPADQAVKMMPAGEGVDPFADKYIYFVDAYNNVYDCVAFEEQGALADGYAYVLGWQVTADGFGGDLFGGAVDFTAAAKAKVVNLDGSVEVVDLAVSYDKITNAFYVAHPVTGSFTKIDNALVKAGFQEVNAWAGYKQVEDEISFLGAAGEAFVANKQNEVGGYTLTSKTVFTYINIVDGVKKSVTGYKNIVVNSADALVVADKKGVVSQIYVVSTVTDMGTSTANLAYAVESGALYNGGVEWTFIVNGTVESKVVAADQTVVAGNIYKLTINSKTGVVVKADEVAKAENAVSGTVSMVDVDFFKYDTVVEGEKVTTAVDLDEKYAVVDFATGAAAELEVKAEVFFFDLDADGDVDLIYVLPVVEE